MNKSTSGCLKNGCFGCLGLILLAILAIVLLSALQLSAKNVDPKPVSIDNSHSLSDTTSLGSGPSTEDLPPEQILENPDTSDGSALGDVLPLPATIVPPVARPGRLVLDLSYGKFRLRRGAPGEDLRVEADYDEGSFELQEEFTDDADGWTYRVSLDSKGGFMGLLIGGSKESRNHVVVTIPEGHPIDIVGQVGTGEFEAELGGLWVRNVDLELGVGEHTLTFDEPTQEPMESFKVEGSVGAIRIDSLGNGSPGEVRFEHSVGDAVLDLSGNWLNDSEVRADFSIGDMRFRLPDNVHLTFDDRGVAIGESRGISRDISELPEDAPSLTLRVEGSIGEISYD